MPSLHDFPPPIENSHNNDAVASGATSSASADAAANSVGETWGTQGQGQGPAKPSLVLRGLTPYWLDRNVATGNDLDLEGLFLLTAPNMSGR